VNSKVAMGDEHTERVSFYTPDLEYAYALVPHRSDGSELQEFGGGGGPLRVTLNVQD